MTEKIKELSKREKLLVVICEMTGGKPGLLKYEDISVQAYKKYQKDFQLRGYPEHVDTETTSKRLSDLRRDGLIQLHNKFIKLTEKGRTAAENLMRSVSEVPSSLKASKAKEYSRDIYNEIERIKKTDAYTFFINGNERQIVDTDFFSYLGTSVRADRLDFQARINTLEGVIEAVKAKDDYKEIVSLHNYLFDRFKSIIEIKLLIGYPRRR